MTEAKIGITLGEGEGVPSPREFFRVGRVIPSDQEVVSMPPGTKVREALDLKRYS
jgi:hypothetical protein